MRAIIAGGTGYIGRRIAAGLSSQGYEVVVLSRDAARSGSELSGLPGTRLVAWNGRDPGGWGQLVEGAELIVNLAGERVAGPGPAFRWSEARKRLLESSRREAGEAICSAIAGARSRPRLLVQFSGIDYYAAGEDLATEDSPAGSSYLSTLVRDHWEPSTARVEGLGVRRIVCRLGPVLGRDSPVLAPLLLQHRLFVGGRLGSGRQWFPWISLDDVVGAVLFLVDRGDASGVYNLVAPGCLRNAGLSRCLGRILSRPSWLPVPAFAIRLAFGEMAATLLEGVHAAPSRLLDAGYRFVHTDIDAAIRSSVKDY